MNKNKCKIDWSKTSSSSDGVILISMSIGIFLIISIFTFFLMKLVVKEHNMSINYSLDIKTRNLAHSALNRGIFQFKNLRNITPQTGQLNNGDYEISFDGINDEDNDPLPYSHYTMLRSDAEINDSRRRTRIFLSSFPSGFNPAFYGENINNSAFNTSSVNGGYLFKQNGNLYHNGNQIPSEGIVESLPNFNNIYDDEINWTQNNVEINTSNSGGNSNNKYLRFDGNDYVKIIYKEEEQITETTNHTIDFEDMGYGPNQNWKQVPDGYRGFEWNYRMYALNANISTHSGYYTAMLAGSADHVMYNAWNENPIWFKTKETNSVFYNTYETNVFTFKGMIAAAAWVNGQKVTLKGFRNNSELYSAEFILSRPSNHPRSGTAARTINVNFENIDSVEIHRQAYGGKGVSDSWVAIDNMRFQTTTSTSTVNTTILPVGNLTRTISAWVRPTNNNNTWSMVQFGTGDCTGKMWGMGRRNGKLGLWGGCKDWISNLSIPTNEWSFVVLRYNGNKVRAYVNGTWQETTLNGFDTQISDLFIGGETTNNGGSFRSYFTGDIDEVAVWNEALTNAEILALYNDGAGRNAATNGGGYNSKANLKGYWRFNDGSGNAIADASGNGKNGTKHGATWQTGSHTQSQPGPLTFNAGSQLNLNSPDCGSDHTSLCIPNKIAVNQSIIFTDTDISGAGIIVSTGKITLKQNSTVSGGITLIANEIELNNCILGNSSMFQSASGPIIIYVENGGLISNASNVSGLLINNGTSSSKNFIIDNATINGAVLNYGINFQLNNSTNIIGSVVSKYLVTIYGGSTITKGDLPSFYNRNTGLIPSVVPGSYLEY